MNSKQKLYIKSTPASQMIAQKLLNTFNELPYADKLKFIKDICIQADYLLLSSICSDVAFGLFHKELHQENLTKKQELYNLQKKLEAIRDTLHNISVSEVEEKYAHLYNSKMK